MKSDTPHSPGDPSMASPRSSAVQPGRGLRRQAEARLRDENPSTGGRQDGSGAEETAQILHELRVHQIELEMQNEELRKAQTEIETGRSRYFDLYNLAPVGYVTVSAQGLILEANRTAATLLGANRDALVRQPLTSFILKADQDTYFLFRKKLSEPHSEQAGLAGATRTCELRLVKPDGAVCWARLDAAATEGPGGERASRIVLSDITECKQVENELRTKNVILKTQHETSPYGVLVVDENKNTLSFNQHFSHLWHIPDDVMAQQNSFKALEYVLHQLPDPDAFVAEIEALYENRQTEKAKEIPLRDGRILERYSFPMFSANGNYAGHIWYYMDITARKQAEEAKTRLVAAIEQSAETIMIANAEGLIVYVNPAFETTTGYPREEILGQNPRLLQGGKHDAEFYREMWALLAAGETWRGRMINKRKDGTLYEEDATISPVLDAAGKIINYVAAKRDVTHQARLEAQLQQAQKMESIGRLAGGVAHDFNNLLMGIMGYTELCRDTIEPDHPIREYLDEIISGAQRSAEITRQLLAFARKQTIAPKILDLNDAVESMFKLLRRMIGEDINLTWRPGTNLRTVKLDPSQVDQILANLCVNARDAIAGVGEVTLETGNAIVDAAFCARHPDAIPGVYVFLSVSDDGCGMDRETLANIFEPFFTTKPTGEGTGLGLATVYGIVKQNNGFIYAYSEPGKGSTFRIYLPQAAAAAAATTVTSNTEAPRGRGETILLAEDEKSLRVTCGLFLKALGYNVLVAETPAEALKLVDQHPGDLHLLLTDVVMPGMDGRQLAQRVGERKPGVKVVFMSGYTADVIAQRGVLDEGVQFLSKPFTRDDLARKVREVLEITES